MFLLSVFGNSSERRMHYEPLQGDPGLGGSPALTTTRTRRASTTSSGPEGDDAGGGDAMRTSLLGLGSPRPKPINLCPDQDSIRHTALVSSKMEAWRLLGADPDVEWAQSKHAPLLAGEDVEPGTRRAVDVAAVYIMDAAHGRRIDYNTDPWSIRKLRMLRSGLYKLFFNTVAIAHLALAVVEPPRAFHCEGDKWAMSWGDSDCRFLPIMLFEGCCFAVYLHDLFLLYRIHNVADVNGRRRVFQRHPWVTLRLLAVFLMVIAWLQYMFTESAFLRYSHALRPLVLITSRRNVRQIFNGCTKAFPRISVIVALLAFTICFWAFTGFLLFQHEDAPYFVSVSESWYTMLLIHTSIPYFQEVMQPYMVGTQAATLFFVSFITLANLFLFKLVIAVSYRSYKEHSRSVLSRRLAKRRDALNRAFLLVSNDEGVVTRGVWVRVLRRIRPDWDARAMATLLFRYVGITSGQGSGVGLADDMTSTHSGSTGAAAAGDPAFEGVDIQGFFELCSLTDVHVRQIMGTSWMSKRYRWIVDWLEHYSEAPYAVRLLGSEVSFVDIFLALAVVVSTMQLLLIANDPADERWKALGTVMLSVFAVEFIVKLMIYGVRDYWKSSYRRLDAIAVVGSIASRLLYPHTSEFSIAFNIALSLKLLRLFKVIRVIPLFDDMLRSVALVLPTLTRLGFVLFSIFYAFSVVGTQLYSGVCTLHLEDPDMLEEDSRYVLYEQQQNFNTFLHSLLALFEVATLGNWTSAMDAIVLCTNDYLNRIYFFVFRILVTTVYLPIVVGYVIEMFLVYTTKVEREKAQREAFRKEHSMDAAQAMHHRARSTAVDRLGAPVGLDDLRHTAPVKEWSLTRDRTHSDVHYVMFDALEGHRTKQMKEAFDEMAADRREARRELGEVSAELEHALRDAAVLRAALAAATRPDSASDAESETSTRL